MVQPSRSEIKKKKRILTRKIKRHGIEVVSRKEQPMPKMEVEVAKLKKQDIEERPVSSSWIATLGYEKGGWLGLKTGTATMETKKGYRYEIDMPFDVFEEWFYAHSKGTFFNYAVRDKYPIRRVS